MSRETSLNGSGNSRQSSRRDGEDSVVGHAAGVMHDVAELFELQAKLLVADSNTIARRAAFPIVLIGVGLAVLLGCTPVALESLAELFLDQLDWPRSLSFLAAAGCGVLLSVLLLSIGWWRIRHALDPLKNSREELARNIASIKRSLKTSGAAPSARQNIEGRRIA